MFQIHYFKSSHQSPIKYILFFFPFYRLRNLPQGQTADKWDIWDYIPASSLKTRIFIRDKSIIFFFERGPPLVKWLETLEDNWGGGWGILALVSVPLQSKKHCARWGRGTEEGEMFGAVGAENRKDQGRIWKTLGRMRVNANLIPEAQIPSFYEFYINI